MESIDNILSLEVKREIAQRFFGFRKTIEEDSAAYLQKVRETADELEHNVGHELVRIYNLLNSPALLHRFFQLTGLPERLFLDSFINTAPRKDDIFTSQKLRGLTRKGCHLNMFFDSYGRLYRAIGHYRSAFEQLAEDHETIRQQIEIFYRKNDIQTIFSFLRGLDPNLTDISPIGPGFSEDLEAKLRLSPPAPVDELLPEIPAIPSSKAIRRKLRELVARANMEQPQLDLRELKSS